MKIKNNVMFSLGHIQNCHIYRISFASSCPFKIRLRRQSLDLIMPIFPYEGPPTPILEWNHHVTGMVIAIRLHCRQHLRYALCYSPSAAGYWLDDYCRTSGILKPLTYYIPAHYHDAVTIHPVTLLEISSISVPPEIMNGLKRVRPPPYQCPSQSEFMHDVAPSLRKLFDVQVDGVFKDFTKMFKTISQVNLGLEKII